MKQHYDSQTPLILGTPNPWIFKKSDKYSIIWSQSFVQKILFSISFNWGGGDIKLLKLATIYIKVSKGLPRVTSPPFERRVAKTLAASLL